jgi:hypothetical protein
MKYLFWWDNKIFEFIKNINETCIDKKVNGSEVIFFNILYIQYIINRKWNLL